MQTQADQWNHHLPPDASQSVRMTTPRLMRTAALRRKRPPAILVLGESLTELKAARADMTRLGNILNTCLEYGNGVFTGKGDIPLVIHRRPYGGELRSIRDALKLLENSSEMMVTILRNEYSAAQEKI